METGIRVIDVGCARDVTEANRPKIVGTRQYRSPEIHFGELDRSDLNSDRMIMYSCASCCLSCPH